MAIYLCGIYCMNNLKDTLLAGYDSAGLKPDMGASCLRFKNPEQLPLDAIGECIADVDPQAFIAATKSAHGKRKK